MLCSFKGAKNSCKALNFSALKLFLATIFCRLAFAFIFSSPRLSSIASVALFGVTMVLVSICMPRSSSFFRVLTRCICSLSISPKSYPYSLRRKCALLSRKSNLNSALLVNIL